MADLLTIDGLTYRLVGWVDWTPTERRIEYAATDERGNAVRWWFRDEDGIAEFMGVFCE